MAHTGPEPDRGVPARAADLEDLAVPLRRDEPEQELAGRPRHLAGSLLTGDTLLPLLGILGLEACEHGAHLLVEHRAEAT